MLVHLPRYLILLVLSAAAHAQEVTYDYGTVNGPYPYGSGSAACKAHEDGDYRATSSSYQGNKYTFTTDGQTGYIGDCILYEQDRIRSTKYVYARATVTECEKPYVGGPSDGQTTSCTAECTGFYTDADASCVYDPDMHADACADYAEAYDPNSFACVDSCPAGELNGVCLKEPEKEDPDEKCNSDTEGYAGYLEKDGQRQNICITDSSCPEGWADGVVNGEQRCIPPEADSPECEYNEIISHDEYGFYCPPLQDAPEPPDDNPPTPEDPNTDTDGDGVPDEYNKDNDPNIDRKQRDEMIDGIGGIEKNTGRTADNTGKIASNTKRGNEISEKGFADVVQAIKDKPVGGNSSGKSTNEEVKEEAETFSAPELQDRGTFADSATRISTAITGSAIYQAASNAITIPSSSTCPTWSMGATEWTPTLTIDQHCPIIEDNRNTIQAVFLAVWAIIAFRTFMEA